MKPFTALAAPSATGLEALPLLDLDRRGGAVAPLIGPADVVRTVQALAARGAALAQRPALDLAAALGRVGARFVDPGDALRREALERLPATSGLSPEMARAVLDGMARDWTEAPLRTLLERELGSVEALDGFATIRGRRVRAIGPGLCVQIVAGSVPGVGVAALLRSLLVKSPTLLKPGRGDVVLPVLFARALREEDAEVADALAVLYWPGGAEDVERVALAAADVATVYGSDLTVSRLRALAPATTRLVAYHHRSSAGVVGRPAMTGDSVRAVAADVARAVALFDQRGCVSPHVVYVEEGELGVEDFAARLADALADLETHLPSGPLDLDEAAAVQQLRGTAELLEPTGGSVRHGGPDATWTVVVEREEGPEIGCVGRVVRVRPVGSLREVPALLEPLGAHLQTLGVAGVGEGLEELAAACGRVGVSRLAPFAAVPFPPSSWLHDGRGPLTELVRWVELESG